MGEIKTQLSEEAEADRLLMEGAVEPQSAVSPALLDIIFGAFVGTAYAQEVPVWRDEIIFPLDPGQGVEIKLVMAEGLDSSFKCNG